MRHPCLAAQEQADHFGGVAGEVVDERRVGQRDVQRCAAGEVETLKWHIGHPQLP